MVVIIFANTSSAFSPRARKLQPSFFLVRCEDHAKHALNNAQDRVKYARIFAQDVDGSERVQSDWTFPASMIGHELFEKRDSAVVARFVVGMRGDAMLVERDQCIDGRSRS